MDLAAHYDALRQTARPRLASGAAELDTLLDSPLDTRRGLTVLARPPAAITAAIEALLADFRRIEPAQYYYPAADMHLTILSIISAHAGFSLAAIEPAAYARAVGEALRGLPPFAIRYAGLTAVPGGVLVQGFPLDEGLQLLREALRAHFRQAGLAHSIDQRYQIQTAHSTVIRFRSPLASPALLVAALERCQRQFIGTFEVNTVELVFSDWYQRAAHTQRLATYRL
ncbi:2'-5' RNA ligase family protein [Hymenobacter cheonanensis]|uniref:2'-5' RNA ligase family protein n=1 Tax=Hymenobacter sp. CA2-7 TaxID=3063993 RepID=UPI0027130611|nr:2'-5' RNA ligase family protein [Hymenobacter sp. CA2-7]MDO7888259.1 mutarotase [Hymenobacter sp. CA2-7]